MAATLPLASALAIITKNMAKQEGLELGIVQGREEGLEQGIVQGLEQGRVQGREQGFEEGREQERYATAQKLKTLGLAVDLIEQATGLTREQIENLSFKESC